MLGVTKKGWRRLFWVFVFGVTMGYFEASIVVYLRELFYPGGFDFPLREINEKLLWVELGREAMSVGMLVALGALAGRSFFERFCLFCMAFGVWDIFYYVFLKLILGWPASLLTWDILFLIPVPWVGPVWAPVLCSVFFIIAGVLAVRGEDTGRPIKPKALEWVAAIAGGLLCILSWCEKAPDIMDFQRPESYAWPLFAAGIILALAAFGRAYLRSLKNPTASKERT